ncbi:NAD(P)-dependent oxidoreductase [Herbiconiux daphne]|uniref:NAD(P)-dependent oxidoreductase n=1 Tax=Herbiconiux daphne TaxID=2970914 RepID=A0ABT2H5E4_9MICO|nr:NAD(P)-dependent oxidoreductase [Herbiconiux daphne]MCS5735159.1 NAD(P)-dependent oxidoreductase [Herbiconiux daphne]
MAADRETIGFVGLGTMGEAMAGVLVEAGHDVVVWNRSPDAAARLVEKGATAASGVDDALATTLVFSMLSAERAVLDVFSPEALAAAPEGAVHVNMATVSAAGADELARLHHEAGVGYVAAPVLGRSTVAAAGSLSILVAGDESAVERATPYFELMGRRVWNFGSTPSDANVVKIGMNYMIIHALQSMSESVAILEARGVDTGRFIELASDSLFPGPVYSGYGAEISQSSYLPAGFTTELGFKDLRLAIDAADASGVVLPTAGVLRDIFDEAIADGQAEWDWASIAEVTRKRSAH